MIFMNTPPRRIVASPQCRDTKIGINTDPWQPDSCEQAPRLTHRAARTSYSTARHRVVHRRRGARPVTLMSVTHEPHTRCARPAVPAVPPITPSAFSMRLSSTRRGARLARRMAEHLLDAWGVPYDSEPHDTLTLVVAELCANAVQHGRVPVGHLPRRGRKPTGLGRDVAVRGRWGATRRVGAELLPPDGPPSGSAAA